MSDYQFYKAMIGFHNNQEISDPELCPMICSELEKYKHELIQEDQDLIDELTSIKFVTKHYHITHPQYKAWLNTIMNKPAIIAYIKKYILD